MRNFFNRQSPISFSDMRGVELLNEYERLISVGDANLFLDYDTTLLFDARDELEEELKTGVLGVELKDRLIRADDLLRDKVVSCIKAYNMRIDQGDNVDFLQAVLIDLGNYGKDEPASKWWYHLVDEER